MKTILALMLLSTNAVACPMLMSDWVCEGAARDYSGKVRLNQSVYDGVTLYGLADSHSLWADGKDHSMGERDIHNTSLLTNYRATCVSTSELHVVLDGFLQDDTSAVTRNEFKLKLGQDGTLSVDQVSYVKTYNRECTSRHVSTCKKASAPIRRR